jgi:hypothetical protein
MNSMAIAIACQLQAIREFVECDNLCAADYIQLSKAAREACTALDRAIARAKNWDATLREYGYLPHDGGDAA